MFDTEKKCCMFFFLTRSFFFFLNNGKDNSCFFPLLPHRVLIFYSLQSERHSQAGTLQRGRWSSGTQLKQLKHPSKLLICLILLMPCDLPLSMSNFAFSLPSSIILPGRVSLKIKYHVPFKFNIAIKKTNKHSEY